MELKNIENKKKNSKKWKKWKHNKQGKTPKIISFDEEVITKSEAEKFYENKATNSDSVESDLQKKKNNLGQETKTDEKVDNINNQEVEDQVEPSEKLNKKRKKNNKAQITETKSDNYINNNSLDIGSKDENLEAEIQSQNEVSVRKDKTKKKANIEQNQTDNLEVSKPRKKRKLQELESEENDDGSQTTATQPKKKESIRDKKRKKHAQLLQEKILKAELASQQKSLNYLSKWKHNRTEWKFEKLKQIWLQQNMYDTAKIPDEFWSTLVEYFSTSKGKVKDTILKEAIKIIEEENLNDENNVIKVTRARDIVQNLQE